MVNIRSHFLTVSDANLQINARFIGRRPEGRPCDNTWIQALGIMFGIHSFTLAAKKVAQWDDAIDQLDFSYDGTPLTMDPVHLSSWTAPNSPFSLERTAPVNTIPLTLPEVAEISVNIDPITKEDDRIHNYQIPADDSFAHLEIQFKFFNMSEKMEGVLGQTYRTDFVNPVKRGVSMPIMGGEHKCKTSDLLSPDCSFCIFTPETSPLPAAKLLSLDPSDTIDCTSKMSNGRGIVRRR